MAEVLKYTEMTKEELLLEQKKLKTQQISTAVLIGFMVGVMAYGFFTKGFGWVYISISLFLIYILNKGGKKIKIMIEQVKAEIEKKSI
jgi:hypothetical protein